MEVLLQTFFCNIPGAQSWISLIKNKSGIEIGGCPSGIFSVKKFLPIILLSILFDGVNFSNKTIGKARLLQQGNNYHYDGKTGFQFILKDKN